ncbi:TetR/AcrR family transcriptional regulator [Streptomyces sp. SP17KL33]|uniref:TetR/AcrR family transcriptional regulator n=1 Tax=unclassified Streptomyces TaxID=2593676 RepID=UPI003FCE8716
MQAGPGSRGTPRSVPPEGRRCGRQPRRGRRPPRRPRGPDHSWRKERSRQAILAATRALVAEKAYETVTVEAIAARAGVGKQTIYRRWPSKSAVAFAALLALSEDADGQSVSADRRTRRLTCRRDSQSFRPLNRSESDNRTARPGRLPPPERPSSSVQPRCGSAGDVDGDSRT